MNVKFKVNTYLHSYIRGLYSYCPNLINLYSILRSDTKIFRRINSTWAESEQVPCSYLNNK